MLIKVGDAAGAHRTVGDQQIVDGTVEGAICSKVRPTDELIRAHANIGRYASPGGSECAVDIQSHVTGGINRSRHMHPCSVDNRAGRSGAVGVDAVLFNGECQIAATSQSRDDNVANASAVSLAKVDHSLPSSGCVEPDPAGNRRCATSGHGGDVSILTRTQIESARYSAAGCLSRW